MGALQQFFGPDAMVFTGALLIVAGLGVVQMLGIGAVDSNFDLDADTGDGWHDWLGLGRVPLLVLLTLLLTVFGVGGLLLQQVATGLFGASLPALIAVPTVALGSLPATGLFARLLAPLLPRDHTTAVCVDDLVGRLGTVVTGVAVPGSPARVRVPDRHGHPHFAMAEPANAGQRFGEGQVILLTARRGGVFQAVAWDNPLLPSALET